MKNLNKLLLLALLLVVCLGHTQAQDANIRVRGVGVDIWNVNGNTPSPNQMIYPIGIPVRFEDREAYSTLGERHFWTERPGIIANKDYATTARPEQYGREGCSLDAISADRATTLLIAVPLPNMDVPGWSRVPGAFRTSIQTLYTYTYNYTTPNEWIDVPYFDEDVPTIIFAEKGKLVFDNPLPLSPLAEGVLIEDKLLPYNRKNSSTSSFYSFDAHFDILSNGDYVAGRNGARFLSEDKGATWTRLGSYSAEHASTFDLNGDLYIIGDESGLSNLESVITRSTDGGQTWSTPVKLGFDGRNSPSRVEVSRGRVWLAVEDARNAIVKIASASVESNLLDARSWSLTERPDNPTEVPNDDSEPCMAIGRDGYPIAFSILEGPVRASSPTQATEMFASNEFRLPSRSSKFDVIYDAVTDKYWAMTSYSPVEGNIRTGLSLFSSTDLKTWELEKVVLQASSPNFHGFQYPSMQIEGDDIVFASRTAYENKYGQAQRWHDSNMLTFHRVRNFRGDNPTNPVCSIVPYINVNNAGWNSVSTATVAVGDAVWFGPQSDEFGASGGTWSYTGPNGQTHSGRSWNLTNFQANQAGTYTVTNTDQNGCTSSLDFVVTIAGSQLQGSFILKNVSTGRVLDANPDGVIVLGPQGSTADRTWNLNPTSGGYVMIDNGEADRGPIAAKPSPGNALTWLPESYNANPYANREWLPVLVSGNVYKFECRDAGRGYIAASASGPINQLDGNATTAHWELISTTAARQAGEGKARSTEADQLLEIGEGALRVYPNPSQGTFNVALEGTDGAHLYLYNSEGRLVYQTEYTGRALPINTGNQIKSGMYLLKSVSKSGNVGTQKVLIK